MRKLLSVIFISLAAAYAVLLIPAPPPSCPAENTRQPFVWNRDQYWSFLESRFTRSVAAGCDSLAPSIKAHSDSLDRQLDLLADHPCQPTDPLFASIEQNLFELAMLIAACPEHTPDFLAQFRTLRASVKHQSRQWDMNSRPARECMYRLLYGGRIAVEEILLQAPPESVMETITGIDEPSATPSTTVLGVRLHSGDILVSRGGAPTSALIARGNDFPGNFSHVALVHVEESTQTVSVIESHIEKGVALASLDDYFKDTKLRVMLLRLRSDHPRIQSDPLLPHRAAEYALQRARNEHIPYDFAMDSDDPDKMFCSEVVLDAYRHVGVELWQGLSNISSPGVRSWLCAFGVRNFTTQEPSDLEYDPQVVVVAEWRDYETLQQDRMDNAVVDVMLEQADEGANLSFNHAMLPSARATKAYCYILNQFGQIGPIPEGMDATAALKNEWFSQRHHNIRDELRRLTGQFRQEHGYPPPYWKLVELARTALSITTAE